MKAKIKSIHDEKTEWCYIVDECSKTTEDLKDMLDQSKTMITSVKSSLEETFSID